MSSSPVRRRRSARTVVVVPLLVVASIAMMQTPAGAAARHRVHARASATMYAKASLAATASVTAKATGTYSSVTASATYTVRYTARGTATASARVVASSNATARSKAGARAKALRQARALARSRAAVKARDLAHDRAYANGYGVAYARAWSLAHSGAQSRADSAAKTKAAVTDTRCGGVALKKSTSTYWSCTFDDEFNDGTIDRSKWVDVTTNAGAPDTGGACFTDSPDNIAERDGYLNLTARKESTPVTCQLAGKQITTDYTAGQVATYTKFAQAYGRFAVRASFPAADVAGLQTALWLWPVQPTLYGPAWPTSGEIDIAEMYSGASDRVIPYLHYNYDPATTNGSTNTNVPTNNYCMIDDVHAFHEYVVEWTPTTFKVIYDGKTCLVDNYRAASPLTGSAPFDQPFFVALTQGLGVGANSLVPGLTPLPATTRVDWVRVWK